MSEWSLMRFEKSRYKSSNFSSMFCGHLYNLCFKGFVANDTKPLLYNQNYLLMGKTFTNISFAFLLLFGTCNPLEEINSNGINITGDFTGRLSQIVRFGNDGQSAFYELSSIADSSSIAYPAFYLRLTEQTGTLEVRSRQEEPLRYYYIVNHGININLSQSIEIRERQFFRGTGIINNEIVDKDDTQTVILNGRL